MPSSLHSLNWKAPKVRVDHAHQLLVDVRLVWRVRTVVQAFAQVPAECKARAAVAGSEVLVWLDDDSGRYA